MATKRSLIAGLVAGVALPALLATGANADHRRHWFFDTYSQYEAGAFNLYAPRRRFRRRPIVIYENPDYPEDDYLDDDYIEVEPRAVKRRHRWRQRRVRYDLVPGLARNGRELLGEPVERRTLARVPLPRSKPLVDRSITTASIEPPARLESAPPVKAARAIKPSNGRISCAKAQEIVAGFGFSGIEAKSCKGSSYDFAAKRDGKPFSIKLSAASGELTEVKRN